MCLSSRQILIGGLLLATGPSAAEIKTVPVPERAPVELKPYGSLASRASIEPSGIVKSRRWPDLFWTLNDSGDEPRIFPVRRDGRTALGEDHEALDGIRIPDAVNVDWEDIATDDDGHLNLIISSEEEQGDLYEVPLARLEWLRR